MPIFSKDSLETLRRRIDLVEVLSAHIDLKPSGAAYKALCPFHDEKTPSFVIQKGDTHYHCFGCGAHGDAIHFMMNYLKMNFLDAVESLAQRFQVPLVQVEEEKQGPNKSALKEALEQACRFYHFMLLHTPEGHSALEYLYQREIDLDFIKHFQLGFAPAAQGMLRKLLHAKFIKDDTMIEAGLLKEGDSPRDFFSDRITFPIRDATGAVIGFSARKYKEETFGGKYVNTPETPLFKKSRVLFGLNYSRKRIAKEQVALIVEGQIDALRLIYEGFNITVAGQGTAFGEGHVKELIALGVRKVFLALDGDEAGQTAAVKIGQLFQKEGIEVGILCLPPKSDPDAFLRTYGKEKFLEMMEKSEDYLSFLVKKQWKSLNADSPEGKNLLVSSLAKQIRSWNHPVLVHESLRRLAKLAQVPEEMIGVGQQHIPNIYIKKSGSVGVETVNPDTVLESDFLRWLLLMGESHPQFLQSAIQSVPVEMLKVTQAKSIYQTIVNNFTHQRPYDLLSLSIDIEQNECQGFLSEVLEKKVNKDKAEEHFQETVQRLFDRNWMEQREAIKCKIQSGNASEEEVFALVKQFDLLKSNPPKFSWNRG